MTFDFTDKVALITGGGGGIGRAAALGFAASGASVVVVDHNSGLGEETVGLIRQTGGDAMFVEADVTKSADVAGYVEKTLGSHGQIDCFFNNAGVEGRVVPLQDYDEAIFDHVIAVNLKGVYLGLRHVLPAMIARKSGTIVNTSSTAGLVGGPEMPAYVASKHAVLGLTKVASADAAPYGIRVNAVCPGQTETRMMRSLEAQRNAENPELIKKSNRAGLPTGRYTLPEEVANVVMFLCSDLSGNVTGTHLVIDGGRTGSGGAMSMLRK